MSLCVYLSELNKSLLDGIRDGNGTLFWRSNFKYTGEFSNDIIQVKILLCYAEGQCF